MKKLIKTIVKKLFPSLIVKFHDIDEIKQNVQEIKQETQNIKQETQNIKQENHDIRQEISNLKQEFNDELAGIRNTLGLLTDKDFNFYKLRKKLEVIEYYQPAYMIGGLDLNPKRNCKDRCRIIEKALNNDFAGLKILDIGASLGYVCYYFADRGAVTEGWESNADNAEAARLIGQINGVPSKILNKSLGMEEIENINAGDYDIIIILSVLHHVIHFNNLDYVKELIKKMLDKIPILIVELALKDEDKSLFWNDALPGNELEIFDLIKDEIEIINLGEFGTHLSVKKRPLYKITKKNKSIMVNNKLYMYDKKTCIAYKESEYPYFCPDLPRFYYFSEKYIIKEYVINDYNNENKIQIFSDIYNMLMLNRIPGLKSTQIMDHEIKANKAIVVFKRDKGELISEIIDKQNITPETVAKDILEFLAILEEINLYHNDIRSWNILWDGRHAQVIDYGIISAISIDDDIISLLITLNAIILKCKENSNIGDKPIPPREVFENTSLLKLYDVIEAGERSPKKLLEIITN